MKIVKATNTDALALTELTLRSKLHWGYTEDQIEGWKDDLTINSDYVDNNEVYKLLVDDILVLGNCAEVNNIVSPNNSTVGGESYNSFAAFDGTSSVPAFPFASGVVLASNGVDMIPTGAPIQNGGGAWAGDPDLEALINQPGNTNNATVVEFDFIIKNTN